jgi:hypothetical protein
MEYVDGETWRHSDASASAGGQGSRDFAQNSAPDWPRRAPRGDPHDLKPKNIMINKRGEW